MYRFVGRDSNHVFTKDGFETDGGDDQVDDASGGM